MPVVPSKNLDMIQFFETHGPVWGPNAAAIGLTAAQITSLSGFVTAARAAYDAQRAADDAKLAATGVFHQNAGDLRVFGGDLVKVIKAFAESTSDPSVYTTAQIPPPAPPVPAGPPAQPTDLAAALLPGGSLRLSWKGTLSDRAYFGVYRRAEGESGFTLLDAPAAKSYDDTAIPAGANQVTYFIQARRDDFRVDSGFYAVSFGAGGTTVVSVAMAA